MQLTLCEQFPQSPACGGAGPVRVHDEAILIHDLMNAPHVSLQRQSHCLTAVTHVSSWKQMGHQTLALRAAGSAAGH